MPKLRSAVAQLCASFPYNCLRFAFGSGVGFHIVLIAELHKEDSEIPTTMDQLTWFASLNFMTAFSAVITGLSMHRLGSGAVALLTSAMFVASWLLYHCSTDATSVLVSRALISLTAANTLSAPYISEISEPQLRGPLLAVAQLAVNVGSFFSLLLGNFVYWRTIALVNVALPILAAVTVLATPNSPTWLASKGRLEEAEKALCWLRGWVEPSEVQAELRALVETAERSKSTEREIAPGRKSFSETFLERSFYVPLGTMVLVFFLHFSSGVAAIRDFSAVILAKASSPVEASLATAIMGAVGVPAVLAMLLAIRRTGKRRLAFVSLGVATLCHAAIALVGFLELQGGYLWVPPAALIVATFAYEAGVGTVVYMFNSEVFPSSVRYVGSAIGMSVSSVMSAVANKSFLYVVEAITLPGTFVGFALMNVAALVAYVFLFPETEGRSLREIEDHYKGTRNLDEREERRTSVEVT